MDVQFIDFLDTGTRHSTRERRKPESNLLIYVPMKGGSAANRTNFHSSNENAAPKRMTAASSSTQANAAPERVTKALRSTQGSAAPKKVSISFKF